MGVAYQSHLDKLQAIRNIFIKAISFIINSVQAGLFCY